LPRAIRPRHRADWAIENVLVVAFVAVLALTHRRLALSRVSCTLLFVFLSLHAIGAHYTYSEVPYDAWARALTGMVFGGDLGIAYVGAQGDPWDGQKDMALAAAGAVLGTAATSLGRRRR
jgi:uncharacterized membrane protein YjdF